MNNKGKEFMFPRNVSKEYGVFKEYTVKDIFTIILPTFLIGMVVVVLPPYNIVIMCIKVMIFLIAMTVVLAVITVKPIKERPNITVRYYLTVRKRYKNMQKLYFIKPQKRRKLEFEKQSNKG